MRRCVWCDAPLPPAHKGHRRREYCDNKGRCKQQMYLFHKRMKQDAERLADPYWKLAYEQLVYRYRWVEARLQDRLKDMEEMQQQLERLEKFLERAEQKLKDCHIDFLARLKALGMSERDIREFEAYWATQMSDTRASG